MFLWNYQEIKAGWAWAKPSNLRKLFKPKTYKFWQNQETPQERLARKQADTTLDPHYKLMLRNLYPESPHWWWGSVVVISWAVGLGCLYGMESTLPCKFDQDTDSMTATRDYTYGHQGGGSSYPHFSPLYAWSSLELRWRSLGFNSISSQSVRCLPAICSKVDLSLTW